MLVERTPATTAAPKRECMGGILAGRRHRVGARRGRPFSCTAICVLLGPGGIAIVPAGGAMIRAIVPRIGLLLAALAFPVAKVRADNPCAAWCDERADWWVEHCEWEGKW